MRLAIRGGTLVTAAEQLRADLGITEGRILQVAEAAFRGTDTMDAFGLLVLPGGVDTHVDLDQLTSNGSVLVDEFAKAFRQKFGSGGFR